MSSRINGPNKSVKGIIMKYFGATLIYLIAFYFLLNILSIADMDCRWFFLLLTVLTFPYYAICVLYGSQAVNLDKKRHLLFVVILGTSPLFFHVLGALSFISYFPLEAIDVFDINALPYKIVFKFMETVKYPMYLYFVYHFIILLFAYVTFYFGMWRVKSRRA